MCDFGGMVDLGGMGGESGTETRNVRRVGN